MNNASHAPEPGLEIAPPSALELLWLNHRGTFLGGAAALVVVLVVVLGVLANNHANRIASETLLANASDASGWNEVISKYPRSAAAGDAMLLLAASLRDAGKIEESDALYSRFSEAFPLSPLAVSGLLGRASNARVTGHPEQALSCYQQATTAYAQSYGAPYALFSAARLLSQQGKTEEVKRVLQALGGTYPASASAQMAGVAPAPAAN